MKKLLFLFCLFPFLVHAQIYIKPNNQWGTIFNRIAVPNTLFFPTGSGAPTDSTWLFSSGGQILSMGAFYYDSTGHHVYAWDPSLKSWHMVDSSGGGGGTTYTADETTLHLTGTVFSINTTYPGQASITTVGTIGTGVWQGTAIGDTYISSAATWNAKLSSAATTSSLTGNGTSGSAIQLVGDANAPGNSMYWGTNSSGAKGFYSLPSGITASNPSATIGLSAQNGSAVTFMRSDAAPALSVTITPTWANVHTFSSPPIFTTLTGYLHGNAASAITATAGVSVADLTGTVSGYTLLVNQNATTGTPAFSKLPYQALANETANTFLGYDGSGVSGLFTATAMTAALNVFTSSLKGLVPLSGGGTTNFLRADGTWAAPSGGGGGTPGNPTASLGLSAINGIATTYMRSDAAPALDVTINPNWSGNHSFFQPVTITDGTITSTYAKNFLGTNSGAGDFFQFWVNGVQTARITKATAKENAKFSLYPTGFGSGNHDQWSATTRPLVIGLPVMYFHPDSATPGSIDFSPGPKNLHGYLVNNGLFWIDVCDRYMDADTVAVATARLGVDSVHAYTDAPAFGGASAKTWEQRWNSVPYFDYDASGAKWIARQWTATADTNAYARYYFVNPNAGSSAAIAFNLSATGGSNGIEYFNLLGSAYTSSPFLQGYGGFYAKGSMTLALLTNGTGSVVVGTSNTERWRTDGSTGSILWGTTSNVASSMFTAVSTAKGMLPPIMTLAQFTAISSKANGLVAILSDSSYRLAHYDGSKIVCFATTDQLGSGGGSSPPFSDNVAIAKNNSDATKLFQLSLSGITTATTRTWSVPDFNGTFAAINHTQTFTADQTVTADVFVNRLINNNASSATFTAHVGAGTSPSITVTGSDQDGVISVTTGTAPSAGSIITIVFGASYPTATFITLTPANAITATLSGTSGVYATALAANFDIISGTVPLASATAYKWFYHVGGH